MANLKKFNVLLIADSNSVMLPKSFKSGLYPEVFKIFDSLFGSTNICFLNDFNLYDRNTIKDLKESSSQLNLKKIFFNRLLIFVELFVGRTLFLEKIRYRYLLDKIQSDFDLVVAITSSPHSGVVACLISKKLNIPFVIFDHKTHYQRNLIRFNHKRLIKQVQKSAKFLVPVSEAMETTLKKFNPDIRTRVIHNPISPKMFLKARGQLSTSLTKFANGSFCFAAWTTWRKIKRLDLLLDAFKELRLKSNIPCKLIVGGSSVSKNLENRMKDDKDILFLGSLDREDIHTLSGFIDCCVICSDHETFGLPIAEAMAQGTPIISTNHGGVENMINKSLGIVVKRGDLNSLSEAMLSILRNNYFCSKKIKLFAKENFHSSVIRAKWLNLLSGFLNKKN